jgi:ABC-2 type transport system permease protein
VTSRLYFPREILPLSVVGGAAVDLGIMLVTLIATAWIQVGPPTVHLLGLIPVLVMLGAWTAALTLAAAAVTVFRRDLNFAVPLVLRVLFIGTPVMYPASLIARSGRWLVRANPVAVAIEGTRDAVYRGRWPEIGLLSVHLGLGLAGLVAAFVLFRRLEPRMTDFA